MQQLTLTLPFRIPRHHLPAFRSAMIELTERTEPLFHNHPTNENPHGSWDYPLIRYTLIRGHAAVVGLGAGATAMTNCLLAKLLGSPTITLRGITYSTTGFRLNNRVIDLKLSDEPFPLGLHRWVALNRDNYKKWKQFVGQKEARQQLLNTALTGHLRALAKRLEPDFLTDDIHAKILRVDQIKKIRWQKADLIGFTVVAESRLRIPDSLGVGRLVAYGFGASMSTQSYRRALGVKPLKKNLVLMEKLP